MTKYISFLAWLAKAMREQLVFDLSKQLLGTAQYVGFHHDRNRWLCPLI